MSFLVVLGLLAVASGSTGAAPASAALVNYYVTASNGVAIPGDGTTNVTVSYSNQIDRVTLFNTTNGGSLVTGTRTSQFGDNAFYRMVDVYLPANYSGDTQIAANAQFFMGVSGTWDGWRVTLYSYNPGTGASTQLNQQTLGTGTGAQTLTVNFTNSATTIPAGRRLRVLIEVDRDDFASTNLLFNAGGANQASCLRVNETLLDTTAPTTSLSSSPVAPDGDGGWFKSPVTVTLSAVDPEGSPTTTYYRWNANPYGVYAGGFSALSGTNTLWYYSTDAIPNTETAKSQVLKVDSAIVAPAMTTPTGAEPTPTPIQGTVNVDATASDAVSGVNYVAFYYFAWNGSGWDAVGTQVGANQTAPVSGSTYRVSWNTGLVADGRYKLQAQLRDVAGNSAFSPAQYVLVDNVGPITALTAPVAASAIRGSAFQIRGTASDADLTSWTLSIKPLSSGSWATLASGTSSVTGVVLHTLNTTLYADGQYQFRLTAVDGIGHSSTDLRTPVTIDNTGPIVSVATPIAADTVDVRFLEAMDPASINPSYFTIAGLTVTGATLLPDGVTVRLTTSAQTVAAPYTVVVKTTSPSVTDVAGNLVQAPATAAFAGYDPANDVTPPIQPEAPLAYSGHGRNSLAWGPSIAPDLAGYNLYRDTSAGGSFATKVNGALLTTTTYADTGYGANGIVYYYKVTAVDKNGNESVKLPASHTELVRVDQNVGVGGAGLQSTNGEVAINVPGAALAAPIALRIDEKTVVPSGTAISFVSPEYFFEPHGQTFALPVTITVKYVPGAVDESTIKLVYYDGSRWRPVEGGSVVNQVQDTVTGTVSHFSGFAAAALDVTPPAPPTVNPTTGSTGFPVSGFIVLTFAEDMDAGTLTNDKVQIRLGGVGGAAISAEAVVLMSDLKKVYIYPDKMLDVSQGYTVWLSGSVTDLAGNPLGVDFTSTFTTAATGVTPHGIYSASSNLCRNCHVVHGAAGPKIFTEATEKQVCYACHDGTGSSYNVKTADNTTPYAWDFGEAVIGTTTKASGSSGSYHPVPTALVHTWVDGTATVTGVTMQCSNCHNAHNMTGTGSRFLAVKKLDPAFSGTYGAKTGNDFCWTCHNTTAATSAGYISSASWNASTGTDHKTNYPAAASGHNKLSGAGVLMDDIRVPSAQSIACKGCHAEHGSTNDKLISEQIKGIAVTFNATSVANYNTQYNIVCRSCHSASGLGGPYWPGNPAAGTSYVNSGHGSTVKTRTLTYSPPVPAKNQALLVGVCKQCHNPHGTQYANYTLAFEEDLCYQCHAAAGPGRLLGPGNFSIQRQFTQGRVGGSTTAPDFTRAYNRSAAGAAVPLSRHPVLEAEQGQTFANIKKNQNGTVSNVTATTGAIECLNCHNPHLNGGSNPSSLYWKVLDADIQPGQAGYPTALPVYATTNTLGGFSYNSGTAAPNADANPDHPLGLHATATQPYNPASGSAEATADSIKFCLACHDNTVPAGTSPVVSMGAADPAGLPMNILTRYLATGNTGLAHGNGRGNYISGSGGSGEVRPRYPYQGSTFSNTAPTRAYAALQCTTCHDAHGSQNVYLLREYIVVDGVNMNASNLYLNGAAINLPTWNVAAGNGSLTNDFIAQFCATCHGRSDTANTAFPGHRGGISGAPNTGTTCDAYHRWSRAQGGTEGLHDNNIARGDERSW